MLICFVYELYAILPSLSRLCYSRPLIILSGLLCIHCASTFSDNGIEQELHILFILCIISTLLLCYCGYYGSGKQCYARCHILVIILMIAYLAHRQTKRASSLVISVGGVTSIISILALVVRYSYDYTKNYHTLLNLILFGITQLLHCVIIMYSYYTGNGHLYIPRLVIGVNLLGLIHSAAVCTVTPPGSSELVLLHFYSLITVVSQPLDIIVANLVYWYVIISRRYLSSNKGTHYALCYCLQIVLFSRLLYFLTNHQHSFSALQLEVGFIGTNQFHYTYAGSLLAINTFGYDILALLWVEHSQLSIGGSRVMSRVIGAVRLCFVLCSCFCVLLLNRHLRLWAVYGPKAVFETVFYIINCVILLSYG